MTSNHWFAGVLGVVALAFAAGGQDAPTLTFGGTEYRFQRLERAAKLPRDLWVNHCGDEGAEPCDLKPPKASQEFVIVRFDLPANGWQGDNPQASDVELLDAESGSHRPSQVALWCRDERCQAAFVFAVDQGLQVERFVLGDGVIDLFAATEPQTSLF